MFILSEKLNEKTIAELAPLIENKEISPVDLVKEVNEQIDRMDEELNAYISVKGEAALEKAREVEAEIHAGNYKGPLHGIPMGIKDNIYFANETTTMGSKIHEDFKPTENAAVIDKLQEAGTIFTGKLNMHEYAWGATNNNPFYGACRNPFDTERISGGSSGGSGVATSAHMTIATLGTDTGGSIRIPASFCNITGLKPTHGLVSKYNSFPLAWSLDHIGPMTKSAKDAAYVLDAIAGYDPRDPVSINVTQKKYSDAFTNTVKGLRIGINEEYFFNNVDHDVEQTVRQAISMLEKEGAIIEEVKVPELAHAEYAEMITIITEASAIHHDHLIEREEDFGDDVRFLLKLGEIPSAVDYLQAQQIRQQLNRGFKRMFEKVDVLITPTVPFLAPKIGEDIVSLNGTNVSFLDHIIRFTGPFNLTGLPVVSVPAGFAEGLPVGMQIIGPAFKEELVLDVAHTFEQINN